MRRYQLLFALFLLATCAAVPAAGVSRAQQSMAQQPAQQQSAQKPKPVQVVLSKMHAVNQMEMKAGQMAQKKSAFEPVQNYGDRLFRDHRSADGKVRALAEALGVKLLPPAKLPGPQKQMKQAQKKAKKLKKQQDQAFDRGFLKLMVKGHTHTIQTLKEALGKLQNEQLKTLIRRLLPILGQHRTLAQHLQQRQT